MKEIGCLPLFAEWGRSVQPFGPQPETTNNETSTTNRYDLLPRYSPDNPFCTRIGLLARAVSKKGSQPSSRTGSSLHEI